MVTAPWCLTVALFRPSASSECVREELNDKSLSLSLTHTHPHHSADTCTSTAVIESSGKTVTSGGVTHSYQVAMALP